MKVIFLDIDGVLNSLTTECGAEGYRLEPAAALQLNSKRCEPN